MDWSDLLRMLLLASAASHGTAARPWHVSLNVQCLKVFKYNEGSKELGSHVEREPSKLFAKICFHRTLRVPTKNPTEPKVVATQRSQVLRSEPCQIHRNRRSDAPARANIEGI